MSGKISVVEHLFIILHSKGDMIEAFSLWDAREFYLQALWYFSWYKSRLCTHFLKEDRRVVTIRDSIACLCTISKQTIFICIFLLISSRYHSCCCCFMQYYKGLFIRTYIEMIFEAYKVAYNWYKILEYRNGKNYSGCPKEQRTSA